MRQMSVISGHPIFTGFHKLTGCQRNPWNRGVTNSHYWPNGRKGKGKKEKSIGY